MFLDLFRPYSDPSLPRRRLRRETVFWGLESYVDYTLHFPKPQNHSRVLAWLSGLSARMQELLSQIQRAAVAGLVRPRAAALPSI